MPATSVNTRQKTL